MKCTFTTSTVQTRRCHFHPPDRTKHSVNGHTHCVTNEALGNQYPSNTLCLMRISTECGCFASARLSQKDTRGGRFTVSSELVDWEFGWDTPSLPPLEVAAGAALGAIQPILQFAIPHWPYQFAIWIRRKDPRHVIAGSCFCAHHEAVIALPLSRLTVLCRWTLLPRRTAGNPYAILFANHVAPCAR